MAFVANTNTSQCSPAWKTGTITNLRELATANFIGSQCSPAWKTGTIIEVAGNLEIYRDVSM